MPKIDINKLDLRIFKHGDKVAPHKPLLILLALSRIQQRAPRLVSYQEIEGPLSELIVKYSNSKPRPQYPFWRLRGDMEGSIWEIPDADSIIKNRSGDVSSKMLIDQNIMAGFQESLFQQLQSNPKELSQFAQKILDDYFPQSLHEDIRNDIGFISEYQNETISRKRDPRFAPRILELYRYCCAICQYGARLGHSLMGLEAAHVKWRAYGGEDHETNGIALCSIHHKAFDSGAISLDEHHRILVSMSLNGQGPLNELFHRYKGQEIAEPTCHDMKVAIEHIWWHQRDIFRG